MALWSIPSRGTVWMEISSHGMVWCRTQCLPFQIPAKASGAPQAKRTLAAFLGKMARPVSGSQMVAPLVAQNVTAKPGVPVFTRTKWTLVDSTIRQLFVIHPREQSTQEQSVEVKRISTTSALGALQAHPLFSMHVEWQVEQIPGAIMELSTGRQRRQSRATLGAAFP